MKIELNVFKSHTKKKEYFKFSDVTKIFHQGSLAW